MHWLILRVQGCSTLWEQQRGVCQALGEVGAEYGVRKGAVLPCWVLGVCIWTSLVRLPFQPLTHEPLDGDPTLPLLDRLVPHAFPLAFG